MNQLSARGRQFALQPAALAGDEGATACCRDSLGDLDRRALRAAGIEFGYDLKDVHQEGSLTGFV